MECAVSAPSVLPPDKPYLKCKVVFRVSTSYRQFDIISNTIVGASRNIQTIIFALRISRMSSIVNC